jgi:indolepyruvate ferredoxin oxidoreductase beta subunit
LLVLKDENIAQHGSFLRKGGWAVVNSDNDLSIDDNMAAKGVNADKIAQEISNPKSVNLIVLGFALARAGQKAGDGINLFCSLADIKKVLRKRFGSRKKLLDASIRALEAGYKKCLK